MRWVAAAVWFGFAAILIAGQGGDPRRHEVAAGDQPLRAEAAFPARVEADATGTADGVRRISEAGYDYGDCHGLQLAVLLVPEPCAEPRAVLIERAAGRQQVR